MLIGTIIFQLTIYIFIDSILRSLFPLSSYLLISWEALFFLYFGYTLIINSHEFIKTLIIPSISSSSTSLSSISTKKENRKDKSSSKSSTTKSTTKGITNASITSPSATTVPKPPASVPIDSVPKKPVYIEEIIKDIMAHRIPTSTSTTVVNFAPYELVLPYPFEIVVHALKNKFQLPNDPLNPTIREVRVIKEDNVQTDHTTNYSYVPDGSLITLRKRDIIVGLKEWIPSMLRWVITVDSLIIEEDSQLFHTQRMFRCTVRNRDLQNIGRLQDQALYRASEINPDWTIYTSFLDIEGVNSIGSRLVNLYVPKPGKPVATSEELVAAHVKILNARLWEFNGAPKQ